MGVDLVRIVGIRNLELLVPEGLPILFEYIMRSENIAIVSTLLVGSVLLYLFCQEKSDSICSGEKTWRCIKDFGFALKSQETIKASVSMDTYTEMDLPTDTNDRTKKDADHTTTAEITEGIGVETKCNDGKIDSET